MSVSRIKKTLGALALGGSAFVMAFAFQGSRGIYAPDEGYYVSIAQTMSETGSFLIPRLQGDLWLDKPPLTLWGIVVGMLCLGQNEWGARAFHALCFVLTSLLVFSLGRLLGGKRVGLFGAIIYGTMTLPFAAANVVTPDTPLTLWTTAAFLCFWRSVEPDARRPHLWKLLLCVALGFGFLTKGPAILVPSTAMLVFLILRRRLLQYILSPWTVLGVALFGVIGLTWYTWVSKEVPGALDYFVDNEVFGRTVSGKYARNPGPTGLLVYPPVVLLGTLPWSIFWWRPLWRGGIRMFRKSAWTTMREDPAKLFLAVWIAVPLLVLSMVSSRLPLYLLPLFPALALVTAMLFRHRAPSDALLPRVLGLPRRATIALIAWMVLLLGLKLGAAYYPSGQDMRTFNRSIEEHLPTTPFEIVAVDEHLEGLSLYRSCVVERVTREAVPYPFFVLPEHLDEEVNEIVSSDHSHVLICQDGDCSGQVRGALSNAGVLFQEIALPFNRCLFSCPPMKAAG